MSDNTIKSARDNSGIPHFNSIAANEFAIGDIGLTAPSTIGASTSQAGDFLLMSQSILNDPTTKPEDAQRLRMAIYRISHAQGDAQRREANAAALDIPAAVIC